MPTQRTDSFDCPFFAVQIKRMVEQMRYQHIRRGIFQDRPNRFIAHVELDGAVETVHVKNTGRCRELLVPGRLVYLERSDKPERKTKFDLIAVEKEGLLINMDAQAPNRVFQEWAESGRWRTDLTCLRPESRFDQSRFDFYWEAAGGAKGFVEVKGVTLEADGLVLFPDAPTERGLKHVEELIACHAEGYEAALCLVVQMERACAFRPNDRTQPAFGEALRRAREAGVDIFARTCHVAPDRITMADPIPVEL